nr:hypothetical protein BAR15_180013 [Bartonella sp. AR 15-3]
MSRKANQKAKKELVFEEIGDYQTVINLNKINKIYCILKYGEMAEWLKAPHSKCGIGATLSGVQIPLSPPDINK